jgi:hypothetical protein
VIKKLKRKKQRPLLLLCMIIVGMNLLAMTLAAVGFAAVKRCKWFSEISSPQRQRHLFLWAEKKSFPNVL